MVPGVKPNPMEWATIKSKILESKDVRDKIERHRLGDPDAKVSLPSICFVGRCKSTRKASAMVPTQYVMIDIDHCTEPVKDIWQHFTSQVSNDWLVDNVLLAHETPSHGLHIFFKAQAGFPTLSQQMDHLNEQFNFGQYGDYDSVVHDFARISFAFLAEEILFENALLFMEIPPVIDAILVNNSLDDDNDKSDSKEEEVKETDWPQFTDDEKKEMDEADWRGVRLKDIIDAWVKFRGKPGKNEIHNYYNEMVKYFRNIMGNNKRLIFYLLPKFGHTDEECWSQIKSICRVNTLSQLDKEFYFFLKDNGYYRSNRKSSLDEYMLSEREPDNTCDIPTAPPVFREFIRSAPKDFKIPMVNALMPILGTLTSYLGAKYPYDDRIHTTSFFSVIYAPPSTGKGFTGRLAFLFDDLNLRDLVMSAREQVFLRAMNRKSNNDKSPEVPHISLRIIPAKNSEAELLQKMQDNNGYHIFTFAPEMDSWAKGEKAAGGNKSDMIRMAWDNDIYGQQYKSYSTFKGKVKLYWNVLITGTQSQVENYFKNVENGLVTRCSFTEIENQEFQLAQVWKPIPAKGMELIHNFMRRCDENTYEDPCTVTPSDLEAVSDDDFDKEIDWRFKFKPRQIIDMSWIMPTIDKFEQEQCQESLLAINKARDAFRRRVGVRGFRLALLCTALYPKVNARAMDCIKKFVWWWMHIDIENMLKLWGVKYNEQNTHVNPLYNVDVYNSLREEFTKNELLVEMKKQQVKSKVSNVIWQWNKNGYIQKIGDDKYKKKKS
ncbi:MAG: DUF3987 domain-containing protein [Prevotella sp.]|nr:DUF3987 domain-containing protein [Prevotella sp.]